MAKRDVQDYYYTMLNQYLEMKNDLKDFDEALKNGYITEDRLAEVQDEIAKVVIPARITSSIELPTELANGQITVSGESSNQDVIGNDGSFFMPETDTDLELTATYYYNGTTEVKKYSVQAYTRESGWAVAYKMYSSAVQSTYTKNAPFAVAKYKDYSVEFVSLNQSVIDNNGVIVQKDHDQEVIIKITISFGESSLSGTFSELSLQKKAGKIDVL